MKNKLIMNCPRCKIELETQLIKELKGAIEIDACKTCQGAWYDQGELNVLEKITQPVFVEVRKIPSEYDQLTALPCPKCKTIMKKAEHSKDENVILDYCESCKGIWLDGGELTAIQKENWFSTIYNFFISM